MSAASAPLMSSEGGVGEEEEEEDTMLLLLNFGINSSPLLLQLQALGQ